MDEKERLTMLLERTPNLFVLHGEYEAAAEYLLANGVGTVVHCKDCEHYRNGSCGHFSYYTFAPDVEDDDYCSYGERKESKNADT
jgi:hypothetical protein